MGMAVGIHKNFVKVCLGSDSELDNLELLTTQVRQMFPDLDFELCFGGLTT